MVNKELWPILGYPGNSFPKGELRCITGTLESNGWETPRKNWKTSTQWKILVNDISKELKIAFQYSKGKVDWLFNFLFLLLPLPFLTKKIGNCRIHLGMWLKILNIENELMNVIREYSGKGYKIRLYGHSQGGGMAKAAHFFIRKKGYSIEKTHTWGAPRVVSLLSNQAWVAKDIVSYESAYDIVPHVPFNFFPNGIIFAALAVYMYLFKEYYVLTGVFSFFFFTCLYKSTGTRIGPWKWYHCFMPWKWGWILPWKWYSGHTCYGEM